MLDTRIIADQLHPHSRPIVAYCDNGFLFVQRCLRSAIAAGWTEEDLEAFILLASAVYDVHELRTMAETWFQISETDTKAESN